MDIHRSPALKRAKAADNNNNNNNNAEHLLLFQMKDVRFTRRGPPVWLLNKSEEAKHCRSSKSHTKRLRATDVKMML